MVHAQIQTDSQPINNISGKRIFPMEGEKDIISSTEENIYEKRPKAFDTKFCMSLPCNIRGTKQNFVQDLKRSLKNKLIKQV